MSPQTELEAAAAKWAAARTDVESGVAMDELDALLDQMRREPA